MNKAIWPFLVCLGTLSFLAGCAEDPCKDKVYLFIVADADFIGAPLYIDGKKEGILREERYTGPEKEMKNLVYASGVRAAYIEGHEPNVSGYHDVCVTPGNHTLRAVYGAYKPSKTFATKKENFMKIDFRGWNIKGP